jgi:uncharacterized protein (DUF1501 family)
MSNHIIVSIFLRGGMDGLSYLVPHNDADYLAARPTISIATKDAIGLDETFGLHPAATPLFDIWNAGDMALIPASGSPAPSRSHFDAMAIMESGVSSRSNDRTGWLGRYLEATATNAQLEAIGVGRIIPRTLLGFTKAIGLSDLATFRLGTIGGRGTTRAGIEASVRHVYELGQDHLDNLIVQQGLAAFGVLDELDSAGLTGAETPDEFGRSPIGDDLWQAAQLIEAGVGVRAITIDFGQWDHHDALGTFDTGRMFEQVDALTFALGGFWNRITDHRDNVTVIVQTEFGRRLKENANGGTDHGHGGVMTVIGGGLTGGIYGDWVGVGNDVLDRGDVPVLTDYRTVLGEVVDRRAQHPEALGDAFPDFEFDSHLGFAG